MFELVSSEDKAKMEAARMCADLAQSQQQKQTSSPTDKAGVDSRDSGKDDTVVADRSSAASSHAVNTAATVSSQLPPSHARFTPFAKNPEKQKRYEAYLESVKAGTSCESQLCKAVFSQIGLSYYW